jgi:Bacterial Ig domain
MEQPNDTQDTSVFGTDYGRTGVGGCGGARTCPERSSVRGVGVTAGRLGFNSIGYIEIASGGSCMFSINIAGEILSSSVSQSPAHGTLQQLNVSTFVYTSEAGYRGRDTFSVQATGNSPTSSGASVTTINATLQ